MPRPLFHRADGLLKGILFLGKLKGIGRSLEIRVCFLSLLVKNGYLISVSELGLEGVEGVRQSVLGDFACLLFAAFLAADIQGQSHSATNPIRGEFGRRYSLRSFSLLGIAVPRGMNCNAVRGTYFAFHD